MREYLDLLRSVPDESLGPHRVLHKKPKRARVFDPYMSELAKAVRRLDERTYEAPSAWHAAAWLMDVVALVGQLETSAATGLVAPYDPIYGPPVFRGQRNPEWRLTPSLSRARDAEASTRALETFVRCCVVLFDYDENRMNTPLAHMAAGQHYGLVTMLLDFTADPRVAVFFACQNADPSKDKLAVVDGTPLATLNELGAALVLPPPWVRRLYAQRGLFLDCSRLPDTADLRTACFRVLFPPEPEYCTWFLLTEPTLLAPDGWYEKAVHWAKQKGEDPKAEPASAAELSKDCGDPLFRWELLMPARMQESMNQFIDMCEWLALRVVKGQLTYDLNLMDLLLRDNEPLFRSYRVMWKYLENTYGASLGVAAHRNRMLAAMQAVTVCVEEHFARGQAGAGAR